MFSTNFAITSKSAKITSAYSVWIGSFAMSLLWATSSNAQSPGLNNRLSLHSNSLIPYPFKISDTPLSFTPNWTRPSTRPVSVLFLPRFAPDMLPVFCKIEHKIGKKMAVPLKFRLGSVDYVDWLEGKPGHAGY